MIRLRVRATTFFEGDGVGVWGAGAFENDDAADWAFRVDDAVGEERIQVVREALRVAADNDGYLEIDDASAAIGAAAVVSSQLPGGYVVSPHYGPKCLADGTMPELPVELRMLAVRALDRVTGDDSEWQELWSEGDETAAFDDVARIRESVMTGQP
jgi:hypothetical protein